MGLNTPILGDELYGIKADRLLLHAEEIQFTHPSTAKNITFKKTADF
jgi:tRNA pseudouridine32 synthase/23S rRNA pseudouridine746 synthase